MLTADDYKYLAQAQKLLEQKRAEYAFNHQQTPDQVRPVVAPIIPQVSQPVQSIKVWPTVALTAVRSKAGGAIRAYFLARDIDRKGSGWVAKDALEMVFRYLKISDRQRRRFVGQALAMGLMVEAEGKYFLANLAKVAIIFGSDIGRPAKMPLKYLACKGWRAALWSAYLVNQNGPISQATKERLTGVSTRTQRNYQRAVPGHKRTNYARTNISSGHLTGIRDHGRPGAFVGKDGKLIFRLPDHRTVPGFMATSCPKGRSKKNQKIVNKNSSFSEVRGNVADNLTRLFFTKNAEKAALRLARKDKPRWDLPREVFQLVETCKFANIWRPVEVTSCLYF